MKASFRFGLIYAWMLTVLFVTNPTKPQACAAMKDWLMDQQAAEKPADDAESDGWKLLGEVIGMTAVDQQMPRKFRRVDYLLFSIFEGKQEVKGIYILGIGGKFFTLNKKGFPIYI